MNTIDRIRVGLFTVLAASVVSIAVGSTAMADSVVFTDGTWNDADGKQTFSQGGITLSAYPSLIYRINVDSTAGLGIDTKYFNDDEITFGFERLLIAFNNPVTLNTVDITQLFNNEGLFKNSSESGYYSVNGGTDVLFSSDGSPNGALLLNINKTDVSNITFKAKFDFYSDYSVKGLTYTAQSVPEPSALLLLGAGLVGLAAWGRILVA